MTHCGRELVPGYIFQANYVKSVAGKIQLVVNGKRLILSDLAFMSRLGSVIIVHGVQVLHKLLYSNRVENIQVDACKFPFLRKWY